MNFDLTACHLYGILDLGYVEPSRALEVTRAMLAGGVQILQLRAKKIPPAEILQLAQILASVCRAAGVPFILNDHPELVGPSGADGVHVGQDDQSVAEARRLAGPGKLVGLSTHSPAQARDAFEQKPDYIGFGPLFRLPPSPTTRRSERPTSPISTATPPSQFSASAESNSKTSPKSSPPARNASSLFRESCKPPTYLLTVWKAFVSCVETGGEGGIRTLGSLLDYGALAKRCFRPLSHLTNFRGAKIITKRSEGQTLARWLAPRRRVPKMPR
jgi:thiamine-phosphate diphosphorylase